MNTYEAFYTPDLEKGKYIPYIYLDEFLRFESNDEYHEVAEVLYNSNWTIDKLIGDDRLKIRKKLFVEETNLPYTEFDIEAL